MTAAAAALSRLGIAFADYLKKASASLKYALHYLTNTNVDVLWQLYSLNERLHELPRRYRVATLAALVAGQLSIAFAVFLWLFTSGGERWVINPLLAEFDFPTVPEHAVKVYSCLKYLFATCLAYNLVKYVLDRRAATVALMDALEVEAAAGTAEERLDATVPRPGEDARVREARQLIALRRLRRRGLFTFDVVPEPQVLPEPQPTEDELQTIREALELDAVKRLNDPKMLREYIRRRESRMGRRKVSKTKERRRIAVRRALRIESQLNAIKEEDSSSQASDKAARRSRSSSPRHFHKDAEGRDGDGASGEGGSPPKKSRSPTKSPRWPVSGTTRAVRLRGPTPSAAARDRANGLGPSPTSSPTSSPSASPPPSRPVSPTSNASSGGGSRGSRGSGGSRPNSPLLPPPPVRASTSDSRAPKVLGKPGPKPGSGGKAPASPAKRSRSSTSGSRSRSSSLASASASASVGAEGKGRALAWDSLAATLSPAAASDASCVVCVTDLSDYYDSSTDAAEVERGDAVRRGDDALDDLTAPSVSDDDGLEDDGRYFSSGDSVSLSDQFVPEELPEDESGAEVEEEEEEDERTMLDDVDMADLRQQRATWCDTRYSPSGPTPTLNAGVAVFSNAAPS